MKPASHSCFGLAGGRNWGWINNNTRRQRCAASIGMPSSQLLLANSKTSPRPLTLSPPPLPPLPDLVPAIHSLCTTIGIQFSQMTVFFPVLPIVTNSVFPNIISNFYSAATYHQEIYMLFGGVAYCGLDRIIGDWFSFGLL